MASSKQPRGFRRQGAAAVLLALSLTGPTAPAHESCADSIALVETALVRLAADRIDGVLGAVADSTKALGDAYARLAAGGDQASPERETWLARRIMQGGTAGFRTWPAELRAHRRPSRPLIRGFTAIGARRSATPCCAR